MRQQDKKAAITKAIRKYLEQSVLLRVVENNVPNLGGYSVTLVPGSEFLMLTTWNPVGTYRSRVSVPRFSDYVVRIGGYQDFMSELKSKEKGVS